MSLLQYLRSDLFYIFIDAVFFVFFISLMISKKNYLTHSFFLLSLLTIKITLFIGFRPFDAGNDTLPYMHAFNALNGVSTAREIGTQAYGNTDASGGVEYLYWPFAAFIKTFISDSFRFFLVLSIILSVSLTYIGNKMIVTSENNTIWPKKIALSIILTYLVFLSYEVAYFGGHIRSALGLPLAFISYIYATKKQHFKSLTFFLISVGFHNSSITIAPLLIMELLGLTLKQSKKSTLAIVSTFCLLFFIGSLYGLDSILKDISVYYSSRYEAYMNMEFNITSVFSTGCFWIISLHITAFLYFGYKKIHLYAFYYFALVLLFSATPKISERYFAYILICLPLLLFESLRMRFGETKSLLIVCTTCLASGLLVITSDGVISTLDIHSFMTK